MDWTFVPSNNQIPMQHKLEDLPIKAEQIEGVNTHSLQLLKKKICIIVNMHFDSKNRHIPPIFEQDIKIAAVRKTA
jgi:hypothetical protein